MFLIPNTKLTVTMESRIGLSTGAQVLVEQGSSGSPPGGVDMAIGFVLISFVSSVDKTFYWLVIEEHTGRDVKC